MIDGVCIFNRIKIHTYAKINKCLFEILFSIYILSHFFGFVNTKKQKNDKLLFSVVKAPLCKGSCHRKVTEGLFLFTILTSCFRTPPSFAQGGLPPNNNLSITLDKTEKIIYNENRKGTT